MNFPQFAFNNVRRNSRAYIAYFLSSAFMVMVFFAYTVFIYHPDVAHNSMGPSAVMSMRIAAYIVYTFAFFFVMYSIGTFLKSRNMEFGILTILGARPGQINKLVFLENMLIGLFSIVTGIGGGLLLSKFFLLFSTKVIGIERLPFYLPLKPMLITASSFIGLFLVISIFTLLFIRKNRVLELLQGNAKPKKPPKASILLSLFGVALLTAGYMLLRVPFNPLTILLAAVTGIGGTYFFYSQLSVVFMRLLQRNRRSTWQGTRLIWISEMSYKLKDNSRMLFLVTVVTALASMGAGVVLSITQEGRALYKANPFAITQTFNHTEADPDRSVVQELLKNAGVKYSETRLDTMFTSIDNGDHNQLLVSLLNVTQYQQLAKEIGLPAIDGLGPDEALLVSGSRTDNSQYVKDGKLTLKELPASPFIIKKMFSIDSTSFMSMNAPILVVPETVIPAISAVESSALKRKVTPSIKYIYKVPEWNQGSTPLPDSPEVLVGRQLEAYSDSVIKNHEDAPFIQSRASSYIILKQSTAMLSFVSIFVALIFSVASASFLYFKLHSELAADIRMYRALSKIGLSTGEMSGAATKQIAILFYIPVFVSAIQSLVVISPILRQIGIVDVISPVLTTLAAYLLLQTVFFMVVKSRYIHSLKKMMV